MVTRWHKKCLFCRKPFDTPNRSQVYCSQKCAAAARKGVSFCPATRKAPQIVRIRMTKFLPVFPEFQLEVGRIYTAEKYTPGPGASVTYIVNRRKDRRTIVRPDECEEVPDAQ